MSKYVVKIYVDVTNARAAIKAARNLAASYGGPRSAVRSPSDAVQYLIDNVPPEQRPGVAIEHVEVEHIINL